MYYLCRRNVHTKRELVLNEFCRLVANHAFDDPFGVLPFPLLNNGNDVLSALPELITLVLALPRYTYRFNDTVEIFATCCERYPFQDFDALQHICNNPRAYHPHVNPQLVAFLTELKTGLLEAHYRYQQTDTQRETDNQIAQYSAYVDNLHAYHSRLAVIRIDLFYLKELDREIELEELESHLKKLHNNSRTNSLFDDLCGYITKIEYGFERHLHVHAFFFFNGNLRQGKCDVHLAKQIGDYWHRVIANST